MRLMKFISFRHGTKYSPPTSYKYIACNYLPLTLIENLLQLNMGFSRETYRGSRENLNRKVIGTYWMKFIWSDNVTAKNKRRTYGNYSSVKNSNATTILIFVEYHFEMSKELSSHERHGSVQESSLTCISFHNLFSFWKKSLLKKY